MRDWWLRVIIRLGPRVKDNNTHSGSKRVWKWGQGGGVAAKTHCLRVPPHSPVPRSCVWRGRWRAAACTAPWDWCPGSHSASLLGHRGHNSHLWWHYQNKVRHCVPSSYSTILHSHCTFLVWFLTLTVSSSHLAILTPHLHHTSPYSHCTFLIPSLALILHFPFTAGNTHCNCLSQHRTFLSHVPILSNLPLTLTTPSRHFNISYIMSSL